MQSARSVVVFLGDAGWGPTHIRLAKESLNFNGRVIPVLLGRVSESELDTLPELFRERRYFEVRQFAASEYDSLAAAIKGQPLEPTSEDSLRDTAAESAADGESRYAFKRTLPAFSSDLVPIFERSGSSKLQDALGVHVYADHLAQLIAAKSTPLPLAIGLFGAWGSGKSHFMGLLQDRLNEIYRPDLKEIFHEKIIQIRFNAWHYLDTNLWANLVCEIFDQLFAALEEPDGNAAAKKIELLKEQLKEKSVLHAEAKAALTAAEAARKDAQEALVAAEIAGSQAKDDFSATFDQLGLIALDAQTRDSLKNAQVTLGISTLSESYTSLRATAGEFQSFSNRVRAVVWAAVHGPSWRGKCSLLLVAVLAPLLIWLLGNTLPDSWDGLSTEFAKICLQVAATAGSCGLWIKTAIQRGNSIIESVETAFAKVEESRRASDFVVKIESKRIARDEAARREEEARCVLQQAESRVREIKAELAELAPGRQLMRFLKERASTDDYRRHLGLVSIVRRDFEELSKLLMRAGSDRNEGLPHVDRIVLYIDDLDRCRAERVVEVLEAVHLLLAFPLFAVVVAVDSRWLRQSLHDHYPRLLAGRNPSPSESNTTPSANATPIPRSMERLQAATPQDYLEKIFQIPFQLQAMERDGFSALIDNLFTKSLGQANVGRTETSSSKEDARDPILAGNQSRVVAARESQAGGDLEQVSHRSPASPELDESANQGKSAAVGESSELRPERLQLSEWELADLVQFQPLFETPRSVKRFANLYSLVRVGVSAANWESFLGNESGCGEYRIPMLLLSVTSAFPSIARPWLAWLATNRGNDWVPSESALNGLLTMQEENATRADWDRLRRAIMSLDLTHWPRASAVSVVNWIPATLRYTF